MCSPTIRPGGSNLNRMSFEFATAGRIVFGPGSVSAVAPAATEFGRRALLVTGSRLGPADELEARLRAAGVEAARFGVEREPTISTIEAGLAQARAADASVVIGLGGG